MPLIYLGFISFDIYFVKRGEYISPFFHFIGIVDPGPDWPDKGEIVYNGVSARYASDLDPVLHDIDIRFQPGEKVGFRDSLGEAGQLIGFLTL